MRAIACALVMCAFAASAPAAATDPSKPVDRWALSSVDSKTGWCSFSNKQFSDWTLRVQRTRTARSAIDVVTSLDNAKKDAEAYLAQRGIHTSLHTAFSATTESTYWMPASNKSAAFVFADHSPLYRVVALADGPELSYTLILTFSPALKTEAPHRLGPASEESMHREMTAVLQRLDSFDRCTPS